jgi:hypothetical protein
MDFIKPEPDPDEETFVTASHVIYIKQDESSVLPTSTVMEMENEVSRMSVHC